MSRSAEFCRSLLALSSAGSEMIGFNRLRGCSAKAEGYGRGTNSKRSAKSFQGRTNLIRLLVCNQRGGVGKTTTVVTLARCFAEKGKRTLVIDMDPQGSIQSLLGLTPQYHLYNFLIERRTLNDCVVHMNGLETGSLDILASNRSTNEAEIMLYKETLREFILATLMRDAEKDYDVVLVDTSPSISLFQNCAAVYCQNTIIPIDMDVLSVQGAYATLHAQGALLGMLQNANQQIPMRIIGLLPLKVHRGLQSTDYGPE